MACEEPHMSIGEAVRCGCVLPQHRELWEADIVGNPDLFLRRDGANAVSAYMSTKTTNCVPHAVIAGRVDGTRLLSPLGSVRLLKHMSSCMGHKSDLHLMVAVGTCKAGDHASNFCPGYGGCVTDFHAFHSENQVATLETITSRKSTNDKTVPHLRFPGVCLEHGVEFPNNRVIIPTCGTLERAVAKIPPFNPDRDVPIGYNPSRWQGVVEAHNKLKSALTVSRTDENVSWESVVTRAVNGLTARHRTRGVSIPRDEMGTLLTEMALHVTRERPFLEPERLDELCRAYSSTRPPRRRVPPDLTDLTVGAMRNRRTIMCHSHIPF
jgi:hypothetical protein